MWTADEIPDQRGRVALVTGANSGLGFEIARQFARKGARVLLAARDPVKGEHARHAIAAELPSAELETRELDLASLESVRACAEGIVADHRRIDLLVNNAGIMAVPERETEDGFELQLGVNHLGHFVLTARLLPLLVATPSARIVSVTSVARFVGPSVSAANPHLRGRYEAWLAYGRAKRANLHFGTELQRRLEDARAGAQSLVAHPGLSATGLQERSVVNSGGGLSQRFFHAAARCTGMAPERAALPVLRAATDPSARPGRLYGPRWGTVGAPVGKPLRTGPRSRRAARVLWKVSERETREKVAVDVL